MNEETFLQFLSEGHRLRFLHCGGNGGDRVIQFATGRLVRDFGARSVAEDEPCDAIAYHGGGLFGFYQDLHVLAEVEPGPEPLVFFPRACLWIDDASLERHIAEFQRIGRPLTIYARDPVSAGEWSRLCEPCGAEVFLSHDCVVLYDLIAGEDKEKLEAIFGPPIEGLVGVCLRRGVESAGWPDFTVEAEQCLHYDPGVSGSVPPADPSNELIDHAFAVYMAQSLMPEIMVTDRLHVMLSRWLFGRQTILLPTAHHKVESVWQHSIQHDARGTIFVKDLEALRGVLDEFGLGLSISDSGGNDGT